jgi:hypothetical protein
LSDSIQPPRLVPKDKARGLLALTNKKQRSLG